MVAHSPLEEREPLLSSTESAAFLPATPQNEKKPWLKLLVLIAISIAIIDLGAFMAAAPITRVFEATLCLQYYREHDPTVIDKDGKTFEVLCKIDVVQQRMSMIFGWQDMLDGIPGVLLAAPLSVLADTIGRKWIFIASIFGSQMSFVWLLLICKSSKLKCSDIGSLNRFY
jgi:hypothetical protein